MKTENLTAKAEVEVNASVDEVWDALVNPKKIEKYMMGAKVSSDWNEGGDIKWKGEWNGNSYEDKGKIIEINPGKILKYSHYSPLGGVKDLPENYHIVTVQLKPGKNSTHLTLTQDKNTSAKELEESEKNWKMMLTTMKKIIEEN
jgi:uncharacterized protein YndB with AHSA1/START domain